MDIQNIPYYQDPPLEIVIRYWYFLVEICPLCIEKLPISNQNCAKSAYFGEIGVLQKFEIRAWLNFNVGTPWHYFDMAVWSWYIFNVEILENVDFNNIL